MIVLAGSIDVSTYFSLRLAATGADATGLVITDLDLTYVRSGATPATKVDATALGSVNAAHADNQAIAVDGTNAPGLYRVDWPDAAFASGVREVILTVRHASCFTEHLRVELNLASAVWDEDATAHQTAGTFGKAVGDPGASGWTIHSAAVQAVTDTQAIVAGTAPVAVNDITVTQHQAIADALLDRANAIETGVTPRGALRLNTAALAGKVSGAGTATETFRNVGDSKNRIVSTVDASGNRTAVTTDTT